MGGPFLSVPRLSPKGQSAMMGEIIPSVQGSAIRGIRAASHNVPQSSVLFQGFFKETAGQGKAHALPGELTWLATSTGQRHWRC
jgi:hypothetical protein